MNKTICPHCDAICAHPMCIDCYCTDKYFQHIKDDLHLSVTRISKVEKDKIDKLGG